MPLSRRQVLAAAAAFSAAPLGPARAQDYPSKRVALVVPFPPGGPVDITARELGGRLQAAWNQPVVIDNRAGGDGIVGAQAVAQAPPDGHTILICSIHHAVAPSVKAKLPYDVEKDFVPVSGAAIFPVILVAHPSVPAKDIKELIVHAKANPGKLTFGSAGTGGGTHLAGELFKSLAGVDMLHVAHRGSAPAMASLLGNHVNLMFADAPTALAQIAGGNVRALAVASPQRTPLAPDLPTMAESGLAGYEAYSWAGVLARAGTPDAIVRKFSADTVAALSDPNAQARLLKAGAEAAPSSPEEFARFFKAEMAKWAKVVKEHKIVVE